MADDVLVFLCCPACGETWHEATIRPGAWWAAGATPEKTAKRVHCRRCDCKPPMQVVNREAQGRLF